MEAEINKDTPNEKSKGYLFKAVRELATVTCVLAGLKAGRRCENFIMEKKKTSGVPRLGTVGAGKVPVG